MIDKKRGTKKDSKIVIKKSKGPSKPKKAAEKKSVTEQPKEETKVVKKEETKEEVFEKVREKVKEETAPKPELVVPVPDKVWVEGLVDTTENGVTIGKYPTFRFRVGDKFQVNARLAEGLAYLKVVKRIDGGT